MTIIQNIIDQVDAIKPTAAVKLIDFYADAGHGWAKVERSELYSMGILSKISPYSYQDQRYVYLEEDCDLATYCHALEAQGIHFDFIDHYHGDDSPIRNLKSFNLAGIV